MFPFFTSQHQVQIVHTWDRRATPVHRRAITRATAHGNFATGLSYFSETVGTGALEIGGGKEIDFITHFIMPVVGLGSKYMAFCNRYLWTTTGCL